MKECCLWCVCLSVNEGWRENKRPGSRTIKSEVSHQGRWQKVFLKGKGGVERKKAVLEERRVRGCSK